jgi:hypothetical protein
MSLGGLFPELGSEMGLTTFDKRGMLLDKDREAEEEAFFKSWAEKLKGLIANEKNPDVRDDQQILLTWIENQIAGYETARKVGQLELLPGARLVFQSLIMLLNPNASSERHKAAVDRFRVYVYGDKDHRPLLEAMQEIMETKIQKLQGKKVVWPLKREVEQYLKESDDYVRAIRELLSQSEREDWSYEIIPFQNQVRNFNSFLRQKVLPHASAFGSTPQALYAQAAREHGVEADVSKLVERAHLAYRNLWSDFQKQAKDLATQHKLKKSDPASVLQTLNTAAKADKEKTADLEGAYRQSAALLDKRLRDGHILTLPKEPLSIRVVMPTSSGPQEAGIPIPYTKAPLFLSPHPDKPEFIIPITPIRPEFVDFDSPYLTKAILAHEGRPGHEVQFIHFLEKGVNLIRNRYAANTVNLEGWGFYSEDLVEPFMTPEEKFFWTKIRLWRVARAFLEAGVQTGKSNVKEIRRLLGHDLGYSQAFVDMEVARLTSSETGDALAGFYGYVLMLDMRAELQKRMGKSFSAQCFNDAVLSFGLLPLRQIQKHLSSPEFQCAPPSRSAIQTYN